MRSALRSLTVAAVALAGLAAASISMPRALAQPAAAPVLEYIAHASFVVQSASGARVVIDPFNSERWLGLTFPDDVKADAVLVSHPHYDHDASYYFPPSTPVFRRPGRYAVADIQVEGHEGRHADPYGRDFGQLNTIWVIETGGVRVAHVGDNGPVSAATLSALGRIDVLLVPADAQKHILSDEAIAAVRTTLAPRLVIPMHYQHEGFLDLPSSLGPASLAGAEALSTHRLVLDREALAKSGRSLILRPSPDVKAWPQPLANAWRLRDGARPPTASAPDPSAARRHLDALKTAAALVPSVVVFQFELAEALVADGQQQEALSILERALAAAGRQDVEYTMRARLLLADLHAQQGRQDLALAQYRLVATGSNRPAQVELATTFLTKHQGR